MNAAPRSSDANHARWLVFALLAAVHFASGGWHVFFGALNADEGFYAVATRAVAQGEMPYRDFGFTQPPLVLYANALPLRLAGFGLFPQRTLNGIWAALALLLAVSWLIRRTNLAWGAAVALFFSLSAPWMYFIHLGKTYGVTTLLAMLAAWAFLELKRGPGRNFALGFLAALGVGTRLPAAPFFGALWLLALWAGERPTAREGAAALGSAVIGTLAIALPFWLAAPEAFQFWVFDFHRASVPLKDWRVEWSEIASLAPAVWVAAGIALATAIWRGRIITREAGVMFAALVTLAANLLPGGTYQEYGVPFLLPLAVAAAALLHEEFKVRKKTSAIALAAGLVVAHLGTAPWFSDETVSPRRGTLSQWLPPHAPSYNPALPAQMDAARHSVEMSLAPAAPLIGPNIILAAETGRAVPRDLRMGPFSFTAPTDGISPERAARLHLATHEELDAWFADPSVTLLAFFKRRELNYGWSMPSFDQLRPDFHEQWFAPIRRDFATVYDGGEFLVVVRKNPHP